MLSSSTLLSATLSPRLPSFTQSPTSHITTTSLSVCSNHHNKRISLIGAANRNKLLCFNTKASTAAGMATEKDVKVFDAEEALSVSLAKYTADLSEKFAKQKIISGSTYFS
ncbi:hypothetical protein L1987_24719 [Smallanthus sonchifolius]|uniref:Uncharacterized protein n=1 Tax=Smallanthus sonchifolius TaxID=185202 RepID=A0ACB9IMJ7_9ASTR|nr:hypothetical protein L1987_24719 [Smallanthus sonchifolius]